MKNIEVDKNVRCEHRFYVSGAGELIFGESINSSCGGVVGFHVGITWGRHGESGGVMDRKEAKKLADFILNQLNNQKPLTKEQMYKEL